MTADGLDFHQVDALARQAVDLLLPEAELTITETPRNNAYVYPQATGGDHGLWRITVTIAPDNHAVLTLNPRQPASAALADLLVELSAACHGHFRGRSFPECPPHDHPALISADPAGVVLICPQDGHRIEVLTPADPRPPSG